MELLLIGDYGARAAACGAWAGCVPARRVTVELARRVAAGAPLAVQAIKGLARARTTGQADGKPALRAAGAEHPSTHGRRRRGPAGPTSLRSVRRASLGVEHEPEADATPSPASATRPSASCPDGTPCPPDVGTPHDDAGRELIDGRYVFVKVPTSGAPIHVRPEGGRALGILRAWAAAGTRARPMSPCCPLRHHGVRANGAT